MLSFIEWLSHPVAYDKTYLNKDVLNLMINQIINFINSSPELEFDYEYHTFCQKFYSFVYKEYYLHEIQEFSPYDNDMYLYFNLKFSEDINDIFTQMRELSKQYSMQLFNSKDTCVPLEEFLFDTLLVEDPYYDSDEENSEENMDYNIDE